MTLQRVGVVIANYNMGESADALHDTIVRQTAWPTDVFVVDNASDLVPPALSTNVWIRPRNKQTTAAFLAGLQEADRRGPYLAYAFMITSASFPDIDQDPVAPLAELLLQDPNAVGVHAALTPDSTTSWGHLITRYDGNAPRRTWMLDNIFSLYRADWFNAIGRFDPELRYAWGIDLETCWIARSQGRGLYVHEGVRIRKVTDIAYQMERMRMSADERRQLAGMNMEIVLSRKYGDRWRWKMFNEYVEPEWL